MNENPPFRRVKDARLPRTVIIGAGAAGLTASYFLLERGSPSVVFEEECQVGGLAKTIKYKDFYFDIGGHRFFTKMDVVRDFWKQILGKDLIRVRRLSRIYYRGKFFDYPLKLRNALSLLGLEESLRVLLSYLNSQIFPYEQEEFFEQYVSNRFGKHLYAIFFKTYTEKVWGISCGELRSEWAAQRIKGLSMFSVARTAILGNHGMTVKSLIEEFDYPILGPGYLWEKVALELGQRGSKIFLNSRVGKICHDGNKIQEICEESGDKYNTHPVDYLLSSMPLRTFLSRMYPLPPAEILHASAQLRYRDLLVVNLIVSRPRVFPDNWIYVHAPEVRVGRIQNYKNWSPRMVADASRTSLGLEYFCFESDPLWNLDDGELIAMGKQDLWELGLAKPEEVEDGFVYRQRKAYPMYDRHFKESLAQIQQYLGQFKNLAVIGRNGMHKYNNQDHSMLTAMLAVENMYGCVHDLWNVNSDTEYQEIVIRPKSAAAG